ncbi:hypothetical protein GGF39_003864 [Coemansia sp. RSA 1721]|nr:hypothetical protein GGF39_003864 [Coemansia sp. RSA 1721]
MCTYYNNYMSSLPEIHLRVIHWMMSGSTVTFAFLTGCIGLQLIFTVVFPKRHIHERIEPLYEPMSFFLGFLITHPILYIYKGVEWASRAQVFHIYDNVRYYKVTAWMTKWVWVFLVCLFLIITTILVFWRMIHIFNQPKQVACSSSSGYPCISKGYEENHKANKRKTWFVTFQSLLYVFVPICTQSWVLVANMIVNYPMWLYVVASIVPATQGMLNLLVFLNHPVFDRQRREMAGKWIKSFYKKRQQSSSTISDTIGNTSASSISISFDDSSHFDEGSKIKHAGY